MPFDLILRQSLVKAARFERESRELRYPAAVAEGRIDRAEAEADLAAWLATEALLRGGAVETDLQWRDLEAAAARALEARTAAAEQALADPGRAWRRDVVRRIHGLLAWHASIFGRPLAELYFERKAA